MLEGLDHIALMCRDLAASKNWYIKVLGMEHVFEGRWEGDPTFLKLGTTFVALFQADAMKPASGETRPRVRIDHFAFRAKDQTAFARARSHLEALGITCTFQDHEISHSVYFKDPDGHTVEITTYDVPAR